jgi:general stress protein YciG
MEKPGPKPGSPGALRIAAAHSGPRDHDRKGGFAADPERAREAGRKGGESLKARHGSAHFAEIGKKGGDTMKARGSEFYAEIGRKGGMNKGKASTQPTE